MELDRCLYKYERCNPNTGVALACAKFLIGALVVGITLYSCTQLYFNWNPEGRCKAVMILEDKSTPNQPDRPWMRRKYGH